MSVSRDMTVKNNEWTQNGGGGGDAHVQSLTYPLTHPTVFVCERVDVTYVNAHTRTHSLTYSPLHAESYPHSVSAVESDSLCL